MRITIGQYYPADSILHRLDPRVKLIGAIAHIAVLLAINNFVGFGIAAIYILALILISKVPFRMFIRGLRSIVFVLMFVVAINVLLAPGETVLVSFSIFSVTAEGLLQAGQMGARIVLIITGTSVLTLATSPLQLTSGIESLLKPLKWIKVPVHDIAMMMTIALRFIPTLASEMDKIIKAQKARGADFESGGPLKRGRNLVPILIPLFVSAFKRADELATAMEARCYRGDNGRTKMNEIKTTPSDILSLGVVVIVSALIVLTRYIL